MPNLNKVIMIGRLTRDPEVRTFQSGGKVAKFSIAVNNPRKNKTTGEWESNPCYLDCSVFNRGEYSALADKAGDYLHKGAEVYIEGKLEQESWDDKATGQKRSKIGVIVDNFSLLSTAMEREPAPKPQAKPQQDAPPDDMEMPF